MKTATQANATAALIFGDEELSSKTLKIKNMDTGEEKIIARDNTIENNVSVQERGLRNNR